MTGEEWDVIEMVMEECWRGDWSEDTGRAYRLVLGELSAEAVMAAVRKLALGGARHRPSVGELAGALNADPGLPSWTEVEEILLGERGLLRGFAGVEMHEVLAAFVEARGRERLAQLPFDDPQWGEVERRRVREDWERFAERAEERRLHGLALQSVGAPRGELRRLRPLAALEYDRPALTDGGGDGDERG